MKIDDVKTNWQSAKNNIRPDFGPNSGGSKTALQRLGDRYSRFSTLGLIIMFLGPVVLLNSGITSFWILGGYFFFTGTASLIDRYLANCIRAIDPAQMPVAEVFGRIMKCRRIHLRFVAIALPLVLILCAATAYSLKTDIYIVYGICTGAFVGLNIGMGVLMKFLRDYREAMQE